jgi:hypothetical protein
VIAPVLPWIPGAGLQILKADATFMGLVANRVDSAPADDASRPYAVVWPAGMVPDDAGGIGWRPMLQVSAWSPKLSGRDVNGVVWQIAARALAVLSGIEHYRYQNFGFTTRAVGMGYHQPDSSRSDSAVLFGAYCQVELIGQAF